MKHEFSKIEIATYLRDFYRTLLVSSLNTNIPFYNVFEYLLRHENKEEYITQQYYDEMVKIYEIMLLSKQYSIYYDTMFNFLQDIHIDSMIIPEKIFVNPKDYSRFSKKQIIKYIRNAFNHNDLEEKELLKIIRDNNEIKIEIYLEKTKPIPFHVIFDIKTFLLIIHELNKTSTKNILTMRSKSPLDIKSNNLKEELNKIYIRKFYSRKKLTQENLRKINELLKSKIRTKEFEQELYSNGLEYKDYKLSIAQKVKIEEDLKYWESKGEKGNDVIFHLVNKVIPLSMTKLRVLTMNLCLTDFYVKKGMSSFSELIQDSKKIYLEKKCDQKSLLYFYVQNYGIDDNILYDCYDFDDLLSITGSIYFGYLFDSLITDEDIKITDEKIYKREKIRNAFVHLRWFKGINDCYKLFDWGNGIDNELNYNWKANIKMNDMINCSEFYYKKALEQIEKQLSNLNKL